MMSLDEITAGGCLFFEKISRGPNREIPVSSHFFVRYYLF